jgi:hypothetical protein
MYARRWWRWCILCQGGFPDADVEGAELDDDEFLVPKVESLPQSGGVADGGDGIGTHRYRYKFEHQIPIWHASYHGFCSRK